MTDKCSAQFRGLECIRDNNHSGCHQAETFESDGEYDLQLIEWWSIKPNGDPVENNND